MVTHFWFHDHESGNELKMSLSNQQAGLERGLQAPCTHLMGGAIPFGMFTSSFFVMHHNCCGACPYQTYQILNIYVGL